MFNLLPCLESPFYSFLLPLPLLFNLVPVGVTFVIPVLPFGLNPPHFSSVVT